MVINFLPHIVEIYEKGGVSIFVHKSVNCLNVNLSRYCKDQDTEVCGLNLESTVLNICVLAANRAPRGNYISFHSGLSSITRSFYKAELKFIICGDINIILWAVIKRR
jgi:hypothetical protein